ncbi:MAG: alpha-1,2-fucosyltransferase [Clostridiales bacterium]|nr:alpha-1,2-fucosyltransferase [Clostridiales bacterium]
MKIVNITGGLGNQMFQYAFALALKNRYPNEKILLDTQHYKTLFFKRYKGINLHNGYEINNIFPNASLPIASPLQLAKISYWIPNYILSRIARKVLPIRKNEYIAPYSMNYSYDKRAFENNANCYYEGYWQCIKYMTAIKKNLIKTFSHAKPNSYNQNLINEISTRNSTGIHVRRGDYLNEPEFKGICGLDYYQKSITHILKHNPDTTFYIFSNDLEWCKEKLIPLTGENKVVFVTENKGAMSCWDMFLMTYCKNLIIANSSFSWWGAFLNENVESVIAPYPWLNRDCEIDLYDNSWIRIKQS